ncbi:MAG: hypothetical protein ABSH01_14765 [Terriglobia bacterium]
MARGKFCVWRRRKQTSSQPKQDYAAPRLNPASRNAVRQLTARRLSILNYF